MTLINGMIIIYCNECNKWHVRLKVAYSPNINDRVVRIGEPSIAYYLSTEERFSASKILIEEVND